jgi:hypothetical protein
VYRTIRKLREYLHAQPEITSTDVVRGESLRVRFTDGVSELWNYRVDRNTHHAFSFDITPENLEFNERLPQFRCQFTHNPLDDDDEKLRHFKYTHGYLNRYCFANVRIFLHRLAKQLSDEGYVDVWYPEDMIASRLQKLRDMDLSSLRMSKTHYRMCGMAVHAVQPLLYTRAPLREISDIEDAWCSGELFTAINRLSRSARTAITRTSLITALRRTRAVRMPSMPVMSMVKIMRDWFPDLGIYNHKWPWVSVISEINNIYSEDVLITDDLGVAQTNKPSIYWGELDDGISISIQSFDTHFLTIIH